MPVADPTVLHVPATRRLASGLLALALLFLQLAPVAAAEITTDLWIYQYGDTVTVSGDGFGANEGVELVTTDPYAVEVDRGTALTDDYGNFVYQFVLLSDVPGIYDVVATGLSSGLSAATQFDPNNFDTTYLQSADPIQYSDVITLNGQLSCAHTGSGAACPSDLSGSSVLVELNPGGGFATIGNAATSGSGTWSTTWQADVLPGAVAFASKATASGGAITGSPNPSKSNTLTVQKEDTGVAYGGATSGTEFASLELSASVSDLDLSVLLPDANLAGANVVTFELFNSANTTSVAGPVSASIDSFGDSTGTPTLTLPAHGTYKLRTSYLGNGYYLGSGPVVTTITVTPADSTGPDIDISTASDPDDVTNWYNLSSSGTGGIDVDVSASDTSGVAAFECSVDGGIAASYNPIGDVIHLGDGQHTVTCNAADSVGNPSNDSAAFDIDQTAPTANVTVTAGTLGDNGWYTSNVTVSTSGLDATSGPPSCSADQYQTTETAGTVFNGSCTDGAGNATDATPLTVKLDKTGPSASLSVTAGTLGDNGWYTSNVTVSTSGSDSISDPTTCTADQFQTTETAGTVFNGSCMNEAGLSTDATPLTVKLDKTAPNNIDFVFGVGPGIPPGDDPPSDPGYTGPYYYFGFVPAGPTSCTADFAISGEDTSVDGHGCDLSGYSASVGDHAIQAKATDLAGNIGYRYRYYTVLTWTVKGFYQPVDMNGIWNTVKGGSTVPLKFEIFAGFTELTDPADVTGFTATPVACPTTGYLADAIEVTATGGTMLRYDGGSGQFIYNWQTPRKPGSCYRVTMTTDDGSTLQANFMLK